MIKTVYAIAVAAIVAAYFVAFPSLSYSVQASSLADPGRQGRNRADHAAARHGLFAKCLAVFRSGSACAMPVIRC